MTKQIDELIERYRRSVEFMFKDLLDVNARGMTGDTLLHSAVIQGNQSDVDLLIVSGANVNAVGDLGATPLHHAASRGLQLIIEKLVASGADTTLKNEFGQTPADLALLRGHKKLLTSLKPNKPSRANIRVAHVAEQDLTIDMNNVYFACTDCKTYVDAGYRWAYWQLEKTGTVLQGAVVEIHRLLSVDSYWKPEPNEQNSWLTSVLSHVEQFIPSHKAHRIVYGDMEHIIGGDADEYGRFAWMNEYPDDETDLQPRNLIEQLGMRTWGEVTSYLASRPRKPWWYESPSARVVARRKFEELILSELHHRGRAREL